MFKDGIVTQVIKIDTLSERLQKICNENKATAFIRKNFVKADKPEFKEGERAEITYISTADIDRDQEILLPSGCDLKEFLKAPQVFWGHNTDEPPIGSNTKEQGGWVKKDQKGILAKTIYANTARAEEIWQLVKDGHLKTSSVGFIPVKWTNKNEPGWSKLIEKLQKDGYVFDPEKVNRIYTKWLLLEHSKVGVPANINALTVAVAKGNIELSEETLDDLGIKSLETKGVIPFRDYGKATEDLEWDAAAQVRQADTETLLKISAWYDSSNPEVKASYKLPHHLATGGNKAVWRGVAAAMAALLGARGGVDIPDADKRGVYNHLTKHYEQFDKEPPQFRDYNDLELKGLFGHDIFDLMLKSLHPELVIPEDVHYAELKDPASYKSFSRSLYPNTKIELIKGIRVNQSLDTWAEDIIGVLIPAEDYTPEQAKSYLVEADFKARVFIPAAVKTEPEKKAKPIVRLGKELGDKSPGKPRIIRHLDPEKDITTSVNDAVSYALNRNRGRI